MEFNQNIGGKTLFFQRSILFFLWLFLISSRAFNSWNGFVLYSHHQEKMTKLQFHFGKRKLSSSPNPWNLVVTRLKLSPLFRDGRKISYILYVHAHDMTTTNMMYYRSTLKITIIKRNACTDADGACRT